MTREELKNVYIDWLNNFAHIDTFAQHYGLYRPEAELLIQLAKSCFENQHPEA